MTTFSVHLSKIFSPEDMQQVAVHPMTNSECIETHHVSSFETAKEIIHSISPNIVCLFSDKTPTSEEWIKAPFIVISSSETQLSNLPGYDALPAHVPILILGTSDIPLHELTKENDTRPIDYLALPVTQELLHHKIVFLNKVSKICAEHHVNFLTLNKQLDAFSSRDSLTGLFNRRHFTTHLVEKMEESEISGKDISLLMMNIDYFNKVNKSAGLVFGDFILNEMAARLTVNTSEHGKCYRFSGEDFVVLLPETNLSKAEEIAETIRNNCTKQPFQNKSKQVSITLSVGIASLCSHTPGNYDDFISMAETALFMAKAEGRNRIKSFVPYSSEGEYTSLESLAFLKETLNRILTKTRSSTIASLQLLARNVVGPEHQQHITTVSHYISLLGKQLHLPEQHIQTFQNAITLYNSIRFLLHNDLLSKPGVFTTTDRKTLNDLPFKLTELTDMFDYFSSERSVLLHHNERFDGTGQPQGLKGDEIPLGARIFNIVDSLAAMNSDRPYRKKMTPPEILDELTKEAGAQFDPHLILHTLNVIEENNLLNIDKTILECTRKNLLQRLPELTI